MARRLAILLLAAAALLGGGCATVGPATGTVCAALGEGFVRYLPVLVPLLNATARLDVGFSVEDAADEEEDGVVDTTEDGARCVCRPA